MDKIDLDAIIIAYGDKNSHRQIIPENWQATADCMKKAIHQAIVLFNSKLSDKVKSLTKPDSFAGWTEDQINAYMTAAHTIRIYGGQIILDVEKLIV